MVALVVAVLLSVVGACAGRNTGQVEYSVSAQKNYDKGLDELKTKDWIAAAKYFAFIKSRFPYSKYAVLSELRIADAEFGAEQYLEAIDSYKLFAKLHPTHEMVVNGYASFRVGEAYARQLPGDFWILPPSFEKDQTPTEEAEAELRTFVKKYPDSPYLPKAKEILAKVGKKLAEHEWYVARYYWDRDKPMATVLRLRRLLERYRGVGYDVEAMWLLGRAYVAVSMPDRARATWEELIATAPKSDRAGEARSAITRLPPPGKPAPAPLPAAKPRPAPDLPTPALPGTKPTTPPAGSPPATPTPAPAGSPAPDPLAKPPG